MPDLHYKVVTAILFFLTSLMGIAFGQGSDVASPPESIEQPIWMISEEKPDTIQVRASTVISLTYSLPTVTDDSDPRKKQNNTPEFNLRNAYLGFQGDIGHKSIVLFTLAGKRIRDTDVNDDQANDDPNSGQLAVSVDRASLFVSAHAAFNIEAGVIRLPWGRFSEDAWGMGIVADSASRRYGLVPDSDLGIGIKGLFPYHIGEYHWAIYNGEDRLQPESTPHKGTGLRLSFIPFYHLSPILKKLGISGFGEFRKRNDPGGDAVNQQANWAVLTDYEISQVGMGAEWMTTYSYFDETKAPRTGGVGSVFLTLEPVWWSKVFIRADLRDPDLSQDHGRESSKNSVITGNPLPADRDGRYYLMTGAQFALGGRMAVAPWVECILYEERKNGRPVAPTVNLTASLYLSF